MARVMVIDDRDVVAETLATRLRDSPMIETCQRAPQLEDGFGGELSGGYAAVFKDHAVDTIVYNPPLSAARQTIPDLADAENVFQQWAGAQIKRVVVLSSAAVYGASHHHPGLIPESRSPSRNNTDLLASKWADLEG